MTEKLKVVARMGNGTLGLIEEDVPAVKPGMALIDVKASLVSPGTELGGGWRALQAEKEHPKPDFSPQPFGYANAGVVREIGEGVTRLKAGDRVAAMGGGYARHATHALVPQNLVAILPDEVTFSQGAYACLSATSLMALRRHQPTFGETIIAAGLGLVGQLAAQLYRLAGTFVIGWDLIGKRLDIAVECGIAAVCNPAMEDAVQESRAFSGGKGCDGAVVSIPGNATRVFHDIEKSLKIAPDGHPYGIITIVGGSQYDYRASLTNCDYRRSSRTGPGYHDAKWELGADYPDVFVRWDTLNNLELCLRLMAEEKLNVTPLTTHTIRIDDVESGIDALLDDPDGALGVVFTMA